MVLSADGTLAVKLGTDDTIRVTEGTSGPVIRYISSHQGSVINIAVSDDDKSLIFLVNDERRSVNYWDIFEGQKRVFDASEDTYRVGFSPKGGTFVEYSPAFITLRSLEDGSMLARVEAKLPEGAPSSLSGDGRYFFALTEPKILQIWDLLRFKVLTSVEIGTAKPTAICASPLGDTLYIGDSEGTVQRWHLASSQQTETVYDAGAGILAMACSPDGRYFVISTTSGEVKVVRLRDFVAIREHDTSGGPFRLIRISKNGNVVFASAVSDELSANTQAVDGDTYVAWTISENKKIQGLELAQSGIKSISLDSTGTSVYFMKNDGNIHGFNVLGSSNPVKLLFPNLLSNSILSAASSNSAADKLLSLTRAVDRTDPLTDLNSPLNDIHSIAGRYVYGVRVPDSPSKTSLLDGVTAKILGIFNKKSPFRFSDDGHYFAVGEDAWLHLYDLPSMSHFSTELPFPVKRIAISKDSLKLGIIQEEKAASLISLVSAQDLSLIASTRVGHRSAGTIAVSHSGNLVAIGGQDRRIKLYAVSGSSMNLIAEFSGHTSGITDITFNNDSSRLFTSSLDNTIKIWDVGSLTLLSTIVEGWNGDLLNLSAAGYVDGSLEATRGVYAVVDGRTFPFQQLYNEMLDPEYVRRLMRRGSVTDYDRSRAVQAFRSGAAPSVKLLEVDEIRNDLVSFRLQVDDEGGGVGSIYWKLNGTVVQKTEGKSSPRHDPGATHGYSTYQSIIGRPGRNHFEVIAFNAAGTKMASAEKHVHLENVTPTEPRLFVLGIGVSRYKHQKLSLNYAASDAQNVVDEFRRHGKSLYSSVFTRTLLDSEVTRANISAAISEIEYLITPSDSFVLYIGGHGTTKEGHYYFLPHDTAVEEDEIELATAIPQSDLNTWISTLKTTNSLVIVDTCESGTLANSAFQQNQLSAFVGNSLPKSVIAASSEVGPAMEGYRQQGILAYALIEGLRLGDVDRNDMINVEELSKWRGRKSASYKPARFRYRSSSATTTERQQLRRWSFIVTCPLKCKN